MKSNLAFSPSSIAVPSVVVVAHRWRLVRHVYDMIKEKGELVVRERASSYIDRRELISGGSQPAGNRTVLCIF